MSGNPLLGTRQRIFKTRRRSGRRNVSGISLVRNPSRSQKSTAAARIGFSNMLKVWRTRTTQFTLQKQIFAVPIGHLASGRPIGGSIHTLSAKQVPARRIYLKISRFRILKAGVVLLL